MKWLVSCLFWIMGVLLISVQPAYAFSFSWVHFPALHPAVESSPLANPSATVRVNTILMHAQGLSPHVLALALVAYHHLRAEGYDPQRVLTIVDYSRPSTEKRMWVIDLKTLQVPYFTLVAQGRNTGTVWARRFSDVPRSLESSIGVYLTGDTYIGKHGRSLRLEGLEPGFNDKAALRDIVMHPANYVSEAFVRLHGYLGRSWGCFALNPQVAPDVISNIKDGTVLFAYYPDAQWLDHSSFLRPLVENA